MRPGVAWWGTMVVLNIAVLADATARGPRLLWPLSILVTAYCVRRFAVVSGLDT